MISNFHLSIRNAVRLAFLVILILIVSVIKLVVEPEEIRMIKSSAADNIRSIGFSTQAQTQAFLLRGGKQAAYLSFQEFLFSNGVSNAVLVDVNDHVVAATNLSWIDRPIDSIKEKRFLLDRSALLRSVMTPVFSTDGGLVSIIGSISFPKGMVPLKDGLAYRQGYFILENDMTPVLGILKERIADFIQLIASVFIVCAILLEALFFISIKQRLSAVFATLNAYREDDYSRRSRISGVDEVGKLGLLVDRVGGHFHRKRAQYKRDLGQFSNIVNDGPSALFALDHYGFLRFMNHACEKILGFKEEELVGKLSNVFLTKKYKDLFDETVSALEGKNHEDLKMESVEAQIITKDNDRVPVIVAGNVVVVAGEPLFVVTIRDISVRISTENRLKELAYSDVLTALPNVNALKMFINRLSVAKGGGEYVFIEVEISQFGAINSTFGYEAGDEVLRVVARRLQSVDFDPQIVARIEGDRFALAFDLSGDRGYREIVDGLKSTVSRPVNYADITIRPEFRFGVLLVPQHTNNPLNVMMYLNRAVKQAKENKRTSVGVFSPRFIKETRDLTLMAQELSEALRRDQLEVYMQPQIDMHTGLIIGAEGLVRWQNKDGKFIPPSEFVTVAERSGLILELGDFVAQEVMKINSQWHRRGGRKIKTAINLSAEQFHQAELVDHIQDYMQANNVDPASVELELTETAVMNDPAVALEKMERLRNMGVELAIDDFGTGYSSLQYLRDLPVTKLKVDRSFVNGLSQQPEQASIVQMVLMLSQRLNMSTVGEGIEREADAQFLRDNGCTIGQGYLFYRPMPAADFLKLVDDEIPYKPKSADTADTADSE